MNEEEISHKQIMAVKRSIKLGRTLQKNHPEIADLYRKGDSMMKIVEDLRITTDYNVTEAVARGATQRAIWGGNGEYGTNQYNGLIPEEERENLAREHQINSGNEILRRGVGIHGLTPEQRTEVAKMGGKVSGSKSYTEGTKIFGMTEEEKSLRTKKAYERGLGALTAEQRHRFAKNAGRKAYECRAGVHGGTPEQKRENARKVVLARGQIPWSNEEIEEAYNLSQQEEYMWDSGSGRGNPNYEKVAQELAKKGYTKRSPLAVKVAINRQRKSLGEKGIRGKAWSQQERRTAYELSRSGEFQHTQGAHKGRHDYKSIAEKLVEMGFPKRTNASIRATINRCRDSLENRMDSNF